MNVGGSPQKMDEKTRLGIYQVLLLLINILFSHNFLS